MPQVKLLKIAHGRSGDKGNGSNVGIIARHPDIYPFLKKELTSEKVKEHMKYVCKGKVERYELPNIGALNFILNENINSKPKLYLLITLLTFFSSLCLYFDQKLLIIPLVVLFKIFQSKIFSCCSHIICI